MLEENDFNQLNSYKQEIDELKMWFEWYDTQIIQHSRFIRLNMESNINLEELDQQAVIKAARIKELKTAIQNFWKEMEEKNNEKVYSY